MQVSADESLHISRLNYYLFYIRTSVAICLFSGSLLRQISSHGQHFPPSMQARLCQCPTVKRDMLQNNHVVILPLRQYLPQFHCRSGPVHIHGIVDTDPGDLSDLFHLKSLLPPAKRLQKRPVPAGCDIRMVIVRKRPVMISRNIQVWHLQRLQLPFQQSQIFQGRIVNNVSCEKYSRESFLIGIFHILLQPFCGADTIPCQVFAPGMGIRDMQKIIFFL